MRCAFVYVFAFVFVYAGYEPLADLIPLSGIRSGSESYLFKLDAILEHEDDGGFVC
jgi:hypothetical protein